MSQFSEKIFKGEAITDHEWIEYLKEAHKAEPSMTSHEFGFVRDENGRTSYDILAQQIRQDVPHVKRVLDLACGDGHLLKVLDGLWNHPVEFVGIDMSKDELALAQENKYQNQVHLKCEMADALSAQSQSFDAVSCHMAFMLMNSAHKISNELHRVMKPGAVFAAVVGGMRKSSNANFTTTFRQVFANFMKEKFPAFVWPHVGDERINTLEGLNEIFSATQYKDVAVRPFVVSAPMTPERAWECYRTTYFVSAMKPENYEDIQQRFLNEARLAEKQELSFALNLITCRRV